jgi:hypothetical protein
VEWRGAQPPDAGGQLALALLRPIAFNQPWGIVISVLRPRYGRGIACGLYKDVLSDRTADLAAAASMWSIDAEVADEQ